jgi:hypothetical protein
MSSHGTDVPPLIEGYLVGARLGSGASASVWRATPLDGGPVVAVKVLVAGPDADRELAVLRAVAHPHVVRLHGAVVLPPDRLALVLDLVDGGTLTSVVAERGQLSPGEVVTVVAPLAQALADLHVDGIEHGDLAPGNVLFDRAGRPVLTDLGTPRITGEPREEVFGTAGYVDPVVLAGGPAGPASDVYGLGALAWFALAGAPPESAPLRVRLAVLAPTAPRALVAAIESAVDPDPAARPLPADLAAALLAACPAEAVWASGRGPDVGGLTHRIRALARESEVEAPVSHRRGRRRPSGAVLRRAAAACVAAGVAAALLLVLPGLLDGGAGAGAGGGGGGEGVAATAAPVSGTASAPVSPPAAEPSPAPVPVRPSASVSAPASVSATASRTAPAVGGPAATPVLAAAAPGLAEVQDVLARLSAGRASSFEHPQRVAPGLWVPGSPAARQHEVALGVLADQGLAYRGVLLGFERVRLVAADADRVQVDALSSASAYDVVDRAGAVVQHVEGSASVPVRLVLERTPDGWRLQDLRPT